MDVNSYAEFEQTALLVSDFCHLLSDDSYMYLCLFSVVAVSAKLLTLILIILSLCFSGDLQGVGVPQHQTRVFHNECQRLAVSGGADGRLGQDGAAEGALGAHV